MAIVSAERATVEALDALDAMVAAKHDRLEDFAAYRQADVRLHVALAETTGNPRLVAASTEAQGEMTRLIAHIAHPPEVLASSNAQHERILAAVRARDAAAAGRAMWEHLRGTEHVLAGLLRGA